MAPLRIVNASLRRLRCRGTGKNPDPLLSLRFEERLSECLRELSSALNGFAPEYFPAGAIKGDR